MGSPSKTTAVKKVEEKTMAETWTFFFTSRDAFLAHPQSEGGVPRHQELRKQGKLFERALLWFSATGGLNPLKM